MRSEKGSITVEAAIIYPIVILVLVTLVFFMIGLYRQVSILSVVNLSVEETAELTNGKDTPLYGMLTSDEIKDSLMNKGEEDTPLLLFGGYLDEALVRRKNNLFFQKINVSVYKSYPVGVSFIDALLGEDGKGFTIYAESEAIIRDPTEFIRNVDMVSDFASRIPSIYQLKTGYRQKLENINSKLVDVFESNPTE